MSQVTLDHLRCEYLSNPLGIDEREPRLSWIMLSEERGQRQTAYQILVASSQEQLAADTGDVWDSGQVMSDQSAHIVYCGLPLKTGQRCWWKVRVWDMDGQPTAYSDPAWWEMGLLEDGDWRAEWIGSGEAERANLQPSAYLRRKFSLDKPIREARIYATAKGVYELRLNGTRVGDAVLSPGWTDYDTRIQYETYDVTDLLRPGANAIGAILGTGWYCGYIGYDNHCKVYGSRPQLLLQMHIRYADGSESWLVSGGGWRATTNGPIRYSDLLMGEYYDARLEMPGWDAPGYDDSAWEQAAVQPRNRLLLVADRAEPVKITQELTPQSITRIDDTMVVVDMGQNMVGWLRLRVQGEAGTTITLRFAEMLNPDGTVYTENLRDAKQTDTFILRGGELEVFEPRFTFHGFRYVEIVGYPGTPALGDVTGCVVHSAASPSGTFACSNEMVNQLHRNITWGQRGNFLSVPTDCPQRNERLGWLGDAQVFVRTACYNMDVAAFFTKWLIDVADAQSRNGAFPNVAPRLARLEDGAPAWGDAGVIVPWTIYRMYGDTRVIECQWESMTRWMDYLEQGSPGLLWVGRLTRNYGDWLSIKADTPKEVLSTAYFAYDAALMADMARAIGREAEAERYQGLFERIKAAFIQAYVAPDGRIRGDTQTVYAMALHMNLLPDNLRAAAASHLAANIAERDGHLSTGFVGVGYLCPALTENGYPDVAYRLLTNETFPSWGYSIRQGATTIWERWDGWTQEKGFQDKGMNSFNHYSLGSVGQWLFHSVAGIEIGQPGFKHIVIRPRIGALSYAQGEYQSLYGTIRSAWAVEDGLLRLSVTIPPNTTGTVHIPSSSPTDIQENGIPIAQVSGIRRVEDTADGAVLAVGAGHYEFTSPYTNH